MDFRGVTMEKATKLSEVRSTCATYPLDREELTKFYVDTSEARGVDMLRRLTLHFNYTPGIYQHVLYLGHRGSGKSTILYQLEQKLKDTYKVIRFSVQEHLDANQINLVDLLFVMYERIFSTCEDVLNETGKEYKILKKIYEDWYSTVEWEQEDEIATSSEMSAGAEISLSAKIINLFAKINSAFRFGTVEKQTIRNQLRKNIPDYIGNLNQLTELVAETYGMPVLFMFEDLEKISPESAETLFIKESMYLSMVHAHMLITTPIHLKYSIEFKRVTNQYFPLIERCPMIAICDAQKERNNIGYETMRKIVYARVSEELIDKDTLELAISYSGGVIRDLFAILRDASLNAEVSYRDTITVDDIEKAFVYLQEFFSDTIHDIHIPVIENVYKNPQGPITTSDVFIELMGAEVIIEYNGEQWRGIHPAVSAYLNKRGILQNQEGE